MFAMKVRPIVRGFSMCTNQYPPGIFL